MSRIRNVRFVIIIALIVSIISISLGYAAFEKVIEIKAHNYYINQTVNKNKWSITFDNIREPIIIGTALVNSKAIVKSTSIDINISLHNINDSVIYTFDIVNKGTIDAKLGTMPIIGGIPNALKDCITYKITHSDGSDINYNEIIKSNEKTTITLEIAYTKLQSTDKDIHFTLSTIFLYKEA